MTEEESKQHYASSAIQDKVSTKPPPKAFAQERFSLFAKRMNPSQHPVRMTFIRFVIDGAGCKLHLAHTSVTQ